MYSFYVNKNPQPTGEHEVHQQGCSYMPAPQNCHYLGMFSSCHGAVIEAKKYYRNVDGCYHCSKPCHTR